MQRLGPGLLSVLVGGPGEDIDDPSEQQRFYILEFGDDDVGGGKGYGQPLFMAEEGKYPAIDAKELHGLSLPENCTQQR
jgi:hypothetical protein